MAAQGESQKALPDRDEAVICDDKAIIPWSTIQNRREFAEETARFPRWEVALPKQDLPYMRSGEIRRSSMRRSTKIRKSCDMVSRGNWPAACTIREPWTHSGRRLSQVRERGGRGLLKDKCWSFPPASEREARMDDPTHRSKKGR